METKRKAPASRRRRSAGRLALAASCLALVGGGAAVAGAQSDEGGLGDLPLDPEWLSNTLERASTTTEVKNNTIDGAIERRDEATADWNEAVAASEDAQAKADKIRAKAAKAEEKGNTAKADKLNAKAQKLEEESTPNPLAKPEYSVVWSSKQNAGDVHGKVAGDILNNPSVNPQGLADLLNPQFLPGLDGWQVIDMRKFDIDGSDNPDYGKVVNFVQLPLPWGLEAEAHHMQYQWQDGEPIVAGALFTDVTFVMGVDDIPNMELQNIIPPQETPLGTIPDAYDAVGDGRFIGTYMGGPEANFGGSPGAVAVFKPDPEKGLVLENEVPAGNVGGVATGNANGVPEPCEVREARPLGTCANPHGIEIRQDLERMVTSDYAEPREIVLDPVKTVDKYAFRPTVRTWDTSDPANPKLVSVAHMPDGPFKQAQRAHDQRGIMESAKTWPYDPEKYPGMLESNGAFAGSMCGGGVFFTPDITALEGDSSEQWQQVWNDGLSQLALDEDSKFLNEPGACAGGAWHQVTRDNKTMFRSVQGRAPNADNYFDQGAEKMIYNIDIQPLIESAKDGEIACDLSRGTDTDGDGEVDLSAIETFQALANGEKVADCPQLIDTLPVDDPTSGGPHWGALDNHSLTAGGAPTRLTFSNYFVARTGIDGDHRFYAVDIDPETLEMSYDEEFRDENTGALGVDFNRRDWPGSPDAGFYKPHSMVFVCPPGICPKD